MKSINHHVWVSLFVCSLLHQHCWSADLNADGVVDIADADLAANVEELEGVLASTRRARGDIDRGRAHTLGVQFQDLLILFDNYGEPGTYADGDLNANGEVNFEDLAIMATNFDQRSYEPPPARQPGQANVELEIGDRLGLRLVGTGEISALRLSSPDGFLAPGTLLDGADPFMWLPSNSPTEIVYASLLPIPVDGVELPAGITAAEHLPLIELSWAELGSYDVFPNAIELVLGDFDGDGVLSGRDIDLLSQETASGSPSEVYDLNQDGLVDNLDIEAWVRDLASTEFGDANLDQTVSFADFLIVSENFAQAGGWSSGDFNGDRSINFADFLLLSQNFGQSFEAMHESTQSVPEPSSVAPVMITLCSLALLRQRRTITSRS